MISLLTALLVGVEFNREIALNHYSSVMNEHYLIDNLKIDNNSTDNINYVNNKPRDLIFIHIPKTAGTSIVKTIRKYNQIDNAEGTNMDLSRGYMNYHGKKTNYICHRNHRPPARYIPNSFVVVRNPYKRLLSEYLFAKDFHWNKPSEANNYTGCTCEDFRNYTIYKYTYYREDINVNDCHYIPQWEYAKNAKYIIHFENLNQELYELWGKFNIKGRLPSNHKTSKSKCNHNEILDLFCFRHKQFLDLTNIFYKLDFMNLNYSMIK